MRSAVGGWVENIRPIPPPRKGLAIIRWLAVASRRFSAAAGSCLVPVSSLRRAQARASGSPVSRAPDASAWYSRERLIGHLDHAGRERAEQDHEQRAEEAGALVVVAGRPG